MTYLFFDTETTGLLDYKKDLLDPSQPRIVQLGAILTTNEGETIAELNAFIKPDGWQIPEELTKIHGITNEKCLNIGLAMPIALGIFNSMKLTCKTRVAHNISFDKQMLAREAGAYGMHHDSGEIQSVCTMQASREIVKMPPTEKMMAAGRKGYKTPSLQEAHKFFMGAEFDNAHDAMADVRACRDVFFKLKQLGAVA